MHQRTQHKPLVILKAQVSRRSGEVSRICPAVFLDRDGTLNEDIGYVLEPEQLRLLPQAGQGVRLLNEAGWPVVVVTNQSPLGRGALTLARFFEINRRLEAALSNDGARIDALYYCPHTPDAGPPCECRKPRPGLLLQAAVDLALDLKLSYLVGDKWSDLAAGREAGCRAILVLSGYGQDAQAEIGQHEFEPDYVAQGLWDAARWIIATGEGCDVSPRAAD
jgi:D-glycero-D-manno-heptose 1,7-bisphosphate phosphatase